MNLGQARSTLWVRAVETADRDGLLLPAAVRDRCTAEAGPPAASEEGHATPGPEAQAFLSRRAALVEAELSRRHPGLHLPAAWPGLGNAPAWIAGAAVFVAGFASAFGWKRQPMELLAFPLLWLIAWNLLVYLWLLLLPLLGRGAGNPSRPLVESATRLLARLRMPRWPGAGGGGPEAEIAARATAQFLREWMPLQAPLLASQARALLHAGALLLALGLMTGLVLLGLRVHYMAGWESSWGVTAEALHTMLRWVLAPAAWITPESIAVMPTLEDIRAWSFQENVRGGHAWGLVKLFVVAAFLYVVLPRTVLWAAARRQSARLLGSFCVAPADDRYFRRLLQAGRGGGEVAAVLFHGIEPTAGLRTRVREVLTDELGGRVALEFLPPVAYGDEAAVATSLEGHEERERMVAVFSLAATPEDEVQGELLRQLAALAPSGHEAPPLVVLDAAPLERFESDGGFRAHYEDRLRSWERFLKGHGVPRPIIAGRAASAMRGDRP